MQRFLNNWSATLPAPVVAAGGSISIDPGQAAKLVCLGSGDHYLLTLVNTADTSWEIIKATANSSGTLTVERNQESSGAKDWPLNTHVTMRYTAGAAEGLGQHQAASDPHPQYATPSDAAAAASDAVAAHVAAADPPPDYVTGTDLAVATAAVGDVLLTLRNSGSSYALAGSVQLNTAYPELFDLVGLVGGTPSVDGVSWYPDPYGVAGVAPTRIAANGAGVWLAGTGTGQAIRSTDAGQTWAEVALGIGTNGVFSFASDGLGVWVAATGNAGSLARSTDDGATWSLVTNTLATVANCIDTDKAGVWVTAGFSGKLARSSNNGASFSLVTSGFGATQINGIATDLAGVWVTVGNAGKMARSSNNGTSWALLTSPFGSTNVRAVATDKAGNWVAVGESGKIARSTDNGATWTKVTGDFGLSLVEDVAFGEGEWIAIQATRALRSDATYPYDVSINFKVPDITAPGRQRQRGYRRGDHPYHVGQGGGDPLLRRDVLDQGSRQVGAAGLRPVPDGGGQRTVRHPDPRDPRRDHSGQLRRHGGNRQQPHAD
jgi:hypothetical protein